MKSKVAVNHLGAIAHEAEKLIAGGCDPRAGRPRSVERGGYGRRL
jgi:hypothetical protein